MRPYWVLLLTLLISPLLCNLTCDSDGVKCVADPSGCTADCDYLLKYKAASADTTQVTYSVGCHGKLISLFVGFDHVISLSIIQILKNKLRLTFDRNA